ncbi:MAG: nucleotidyltransferase domain-containing protein, partial [Bacteroidota bacterium]
LFERYRVERVYAFGSVLTDRFDTDHRSDIDLIVELEAMPPLVRGECIINLWEALEDLLARRVDLITNYPVKNPYLQASIERTKKLLYDRKSRKVSS